MLRHAHSSRQEAAVYPGQLGSALCEDPGQDGVGRKETNGGNARIQTAGSLGCMAEANNIGKQLYSN